MITENIIVQRSIPPEHLQEYMSCLNRNDNVLRENLNGIMWELSTPASEKNSQLTHIGKLMRDAMDDMEVEDDS